MFKSRPLADAVAKHVGGGTPSRQVAAYWHGPIPWASVKDFADGSDALLSTQESITAAGLSASASSLIPAETPLVCTRMAVGRSAKALMPVAINQDVKALWPASGTTSAYLLRLLQFVQPRAEAAAVGSTVKGIRIQDYLSIAVPMAPSEEQGRIASILDSLDATIHQTEAIIEKLKLVKQGLLHDILTRGIDANGELRPPQSQAPDLYMDSPLGWIPREWRTLAVSELTRVTVGHVGPIEEHFDDSDDGIALLSTTSIGDDGRLQGEHRKVTRAFDRSHSNSHLRSGDLIVARHGKSGATAVVPDSMEEAQSLNVVIVRTADSFLSPFLAAWLNHPKARKVLLGGQAGSVQPIVGTRGIASLIVAMPSRDEQEAICARQVALLDRLDVESLLVRSLRSLQSGLMDDLLTGRVRVTPLPA